MNDKKITGEKAKDVDRDLDERQAPENNDRENMEETGEAIPSTFGTSDDFWGDDTNNEGNDDDIPEDIEEDIEVLKAPPSVTRAEDDDENEGPKEDRPGQAR